MYIKKVSKKNTLVDNDYLLQLLKDNVVQNNFLYLSTNNLLYHSKAVEAQDNIDLIVKLINH